MAIGNQPIPMAPKIHPISGHTRRRVRRMAIELLCHLTEDRIGGPGVLVGQLPNGDRLMVLRIKKARGEPRHWKMFVDIDTSAAQEVIYRALFGKEAKDQADDP